MGIFRRKEETLNEIELREAGLDTERGDSPKQERPDSPEVSSPPDPFDPWAGQLRRAMARPAVWDLVTSVHAPGIGGDTVEFATLPDGDLIIDTESGDGDLSPLADAVEKQLQPPYRVLARKEDDDVWGIAAREIDVVELHLDEGDEIELVENEGVTELRVDGEPRNEPIPELERAADTLGSDFVVQADRLDGDLWEIRVSAL